MNDIVKEVEEKVWDVLSKNQGLRAMDLTLLVSNEVYYELVKSNGFSMTKKDCKSWRDIDVVRADIKGFKLSRAFQ